jgi:hypothetical protein
MFSESRRLSSSGLAEVDALADARRRITSFERDLAHESMGEGMQDHAANAA